LVCRRLSRARRNRQVRAEDGATSITAPERCGGKHRCRHDHSDSQRTHQTPGPSEVRATVKERI
jgi:hypothetical protein